MLQPNHQGSVNRFCIIH